MSARLVYQVQVDGDHECYVGRNMGEACEAAWREYCRLLELDLEEVDVAKERQHFEEEILQSCTLIGELKN